MEPRKRLTHRQYFFLQTVRRHPEGVPMLHWPRGATMRRWMRNPLFMRAMLALRESMRFEMVFILSGTAVRSAKILCGMLDEYNVQDTTVDFDKRSASLLRVLRTAHIRERETRPSARERVAQQAEALSSVRTATVVRQETPAIAGHYTGPVAPKLAAHASKLLVDVWGSFDQPLADERSSQTDVAPDSSTPPAIVNPSQLTSGPERGKSS